MGSTSLWLQLRTGIKSVGVAKRVDLAVFSPQERNEVVIT